jgi:endonuclease III-like uncharacterized protein
MSVSSSGEVQKIVSILRDRYGEITWRLRDSDEVTMGVILTRQASWENMTCALTELRSRKTPAHIVDYTKEFCIKRGLTHVFW